MQKKNSLLRLMGIVLLLTVFSSSAIASGYDVASAKNYTAKIQLQSPIDINLEVNGVKLDSIFFDREKLEAFVILRNRTPSSVNPNVGVALFDKKGKLLATGIDSTGFSFTGGDIDAGDQKNFKLDFSRYINDYKKVSKFQLVFSLGKEKKEKSSDDASSSDDDY